MGNHKVITLDDLYTPIQEDLDRVEVRLKEELSSDNPFVQKLLTHSSKFQGKRIRPSLLLYSARIFGGVHDIHIGLSAVLEMVHNATLVHDDVLDDAHLRRKVLTLNSMWGNEPSVLFGDYLFAKAFALCARLDNTEANIVLADATQNTCVGELSQISTRFNAELTEEQYFDIIRSKTASLFAAACRLGAIGWKPEPRKIEALSRYGELFGIAFQIIDDCLDLVGDERQVGKSLGTDLDKGKMTLPVLLLLRALPEAERASLQKTLASPDGIPEKRGTILRLLEEHDIVPLAMRRAGEFAEEAQGCLREAGTSTYTEHLHALAEFALQRRS